MPWLVASGLFAVAAVALQLGAPGTRVYVDLPGPMATTPYGLILGTEL